MAFLHWLLVGHVRWKSQSDPPECWKPLAHGEILAAIGDVAGVKVRDSALYCGDRKLTEIGPYLCLCYTNPIVAAAGLEIAINLATRLGCSVLERSSGEPFSVERLRARLAVARECHPDGCEFDDL